MRSGREAAPRERVELDSTLAPLQQRLGRLEAARTTLDRLLASDDPARWRWQALALDRELERWESAERILLEMLAVPGAPRELEGLHLDLLARLGRHAELDAKLEKLAAAPSDEDRLHHFLWRPVRFLPPRGEIAIFNRSYYEEVLVVRVHPEFLDGQWIPPELRKDHKKLWKTRYDEINSFEAMSCRNNMLVLKFFLNVSKQEQRKRFLERLENPEKNWKFSMADIRERGHWDEYQEVYEDMLSATSTEHAPWHVIPADRKWFMRLAAAAVIIDKLMTLDPQWPTVDEARLAEMAEARDELLGEGPRRDDG